MSAAGTPPANTRPPPTRARANTHPSDEPMYEEEEIEEYFSDDVMDEDGDKANVDEQENVVVSGDAAAGAGQARGGKSLKERRIANEDRTTTPYMTKYERARILGTRALQIRYVSVAGAGVVCGFVEANGV
ncbi:DNA-directed RNA polymerase subunit omega [Candidatus Bathyarchaeota archaeon]|nr:DNA-directed RNA polymerase subunit omega [Candidatus Bathyarchaeota archaeon]